LLKECPICGSPCSACSVPELIAPQLVDPLWFYLMAYINSSIACSSIWTAEDNIVAHVTSACVFSCLWQTKPTAVSTSMARVPSRQRPTSVSTPLPRRQFKGIPTHKLQDLQSCGHTSHVKRTSSRSTVARCFRSYASTSTTTGGQMGTD
jgi:hypothetical protein